MSEGGITADVQESEEHLWNMSCDLPDVCFIPDDPPKENKDGDKDVDMEEKHLEPVKLHIEDAFQIAQALQASLDNGLDNVLQGSPKGFSEKETFDKKLVTFRDHTSIIQDLEQHVISTEQFFLVVRRGVPVQRVIALWQQERKKKSPENIVRIRYLGEEGIDSGALAREFFAETISEIGKTSFPEGAPADFTLYVRNESFRTAGEIVAASLAQNGPPPNFLAPVIFDTLINLNMDIRGLSPDKHLTGEERQMFDTIKQDVTKHHDYILEHGYTGIISEKHTNGILGSILVSISNKRVLCLKEFMEGMGLYGLANILSHSPAACKPLFVKGLINDADVNYLTEVLQPQYSPEGSSRRLIEEKIVDHFQDFLLSLEDDNITGYSAPVAWNYDEDGQPQDMGEMFHSQSHIFSCCV